MKVSVEIWPVKKSGSEALNLGLTGTRSLAHTISLVAGHVAFEINCWRPPIRKHRLLQTRHSHWLDNVRPLLI